MQNLAQESPSALMARIEIRQNIRRGFLDNLPLSSIRIARWAAARAKPISCETTTIVMPSRARFNITSIPHEIISGSRALVGSSKSMIFRIHKPMPAQSYPACCPPESWAGWCDFLRVPPYAVIPWRWLRPSSFFRLRTIRRPGKYFPAR